MCGVRYSVVEVSLTLFPLVMPVVRASPHTYAFCVLLVFRLTESY